MSTIVGSMLHFKYSYKNICVVAEPHHYPNQRKSSY
uniref:Uncharacterized protein n=1 Tax=Anguilla anguilla TaxID=7936 RepID=A0A0E9PFQ2_ANGAN